MSISRTLMLVAGAIAVGAVTLGAVIERPTAQSDSFPRQIQVAASAMVYAKPDQATVVLGVTKTGARVLGTKAECDASMQKIQTAMVKAGVKPEDIQTVEYTIYPFQTKPTTPRQWKVTHRVSVKIRNVDKVATVVDAAAAGGANSISNIQFGIEDVLGLKVKARGEALRIAHDKASQIAAASGVKLGVPVSISDQSQEGMPYQYGFNEAMPAMDVGGYVGRMPLASGQVGVTVQVSASYAIE